MLHLRSEGSYPLRIDISITSPTLYLDSCVVSRLVSSSTPGRDLRDRLLTKNGTLFLSWAHFLELSGLGTSPAYQQIKEYLGSFGASFLILDADSGAVIRREREWQPGLQNPAIDEDFMKQVGLSWDGLSPFNVTVLLQAFQEDPAILKRVRGFHKQHKDGLADIFREARRKCRTDPETRQTLGNASYMHIPGSPPTEYVRNQLMRECIITNDAFNESDGIDFEHTIVSVACSDIVVLDKKWARRCRAIDLPTGTAEVYDVTELAEVVDRISNWS